MGKGKKKTPAQLARQFALVKYYKWQFLRRNDEYVQDCQQWSGRKRDKWAANEIIIGYPFKGFKGPVPGDLYGHRLRGLSEYHRKHYQEWWWLSISRRQNVSTSRGKALRPWLPYAEKWAINLPLNPDHDFVPSFVEVAPYQAVKEPQMWLCSPDGVLDNDIGLEHSTKSLIEVDWAASPELLRHEFGRILQQCVFLAQLKWDVEYPKPRFERFKKYLDVWDAHAKGQTRAQIAHAFYGDLPKGSKDNLEMTKRHVTDDLQIVRRLIKEGYKTLGAPLIREKGRPQRP